MMVAEPVQGSTPIRELMERYPDGRAADLMIRLGWSCAYCAAREAEPLSLAAKRHGNPVRAVIECFRALAEGGPSADQVAHAGNKRKTRRDPLAKWRGEGVTPL
jgi:hypothetical protein